MTAAKTVAAMPNPALDRILVGMSGGVDSSVCVQILRDQGFAVEGAVIRFSPAHDKAVEEAKKVAAQLGVPLRVLDCEDRFNEAVIRPFCDSYCKGRTPNPCVLCNPAVKFKAMCDAADEMGIRYIASGHYARIAETPHGFAVQKAVSTARDQSYMLYRLPQEILSRLCLPLGEFEKPAIREMAREMGLCCADAPDSQEICFIPDGDYAGYIQAHGYAGLEGWFIAPDGKRLTPHKGVMHYTVGQRKGLGLSLNRPAFVKRICDNGDIQLGFSGDEFYDGITLSDVVAPLKPFAAGEQYEIKIRSVATPVACTIVDANDDRLALRFAEPARAPAPGQSAVLYHGDIVTGGGFIEDMI